MSQSHRSPGRRTTRLLFVRHGESVATVQRRLAGAGSCHGLSPLGRQQALCLGERFAAGWEQRIDLLVSSPVPRAWQTAEVLSGAIGLAPQPDPDWEEHRPGQADGLRFDEIVARFGPAPADHDPDHRWWPDAETLAEFRGRVVGALGALVERGAGRTVLVTCHGGVIDVVFRHLLGLPLQVTFDLWTLNTAITEFAARHAEGEPPSRWRLVRYNDAAHLGGLPAASPQAAAVPG